MNIYVCPTCARGIAALADVINGPGAGPPAAFTIGDVRVYLVPPSPELIRHEEKHTEQCARYCPRWLRWVPWKARVWAGTPGFLLAYRRAHMAYGYEQNPFELEAVAAEGGTA